MSETKEKLIGSAEIGSTPKPEKKLIFKLKDDCLSADKLIPGSITGEKIADNAIDTNHLKDGCVTAPKLAPNISHAIISMVMQDIDKIWAKWHHF